MVAGDFNLIYKAADKNSVNPTELWWVSSGVSWMMLRLRKYPFWGANILGRMKDLLWADWIGLSLVWVGKVYSLILFHKGQHRQFRTIAHPTLGWRSKQKERDASILRVSGPGSLVSLRLNRTGMLLYSLTVQSSACFLNCSASIGIYFSGAKERLETTSVGNGQRDFCISWKLQGILVTSLTTKNGWERS